MADQATENAASDTVSNITKSEVSEGSKSTSMLSNIRTIYSSLLSTSTGPFPVPDPVPELYACRQALVSDIKDIETLETALTRAVFGEVNLAQLMYVIWLFSCIHVAFLS
ncbi:hypothetical protein J6590_040237 [Homalodisca vitripennis]|nr:hypothetical protein J6590_040237 [Homalodisca vitripennis]